MKHRFFLYTDNKEASQTPSVIIPFKKIINKFDRIIEIGFYKGGFTLWLYQNKNKNTELIAYDINPKYKDQSITEPIDFRIGDCFNSRKEEIFSFINAPGRTLVLCDGGNKEEEFKLFGKILKSKDVIMLHDYAHSLEDYNSIKKSLGWPTPAESFYDNIKEFCKENNLLPYKYKSFKSVLWGSFIKAEIN